MKNPFTRKDEQRFDDYKCTFSTPEGKRVLEDLMRRFHALEPTFGNDPYVTSFNEGSRNAILYILTQMRWAEGDYRRFVDELPILEEDQPLS